MSSSESDEESEIIKPSRRRTKESMTSEKWAIFQENNNKKSKAWRDRKKSEHLNQLFMGRALLKLYKDGKLFHIDGVKILFECED